MTGRCQTSVVLVRLALLGASAAAFQTLFSRAFLAAFSGNEAVLAALLAPWLLLTALGAALGRSKTARPPWQLSLALFLYGPLATAALLGARILPRAFPVGASLGAGAALLWATLLLAPACLLSGLSFSWLAANDQAGAGRSYLAESLGAAVAGALLSLVLLGHLPSLFVSAIIVVISSLAAALGSSRKVVAVWVAAGLALAAPIASPRLARWSLSTQGPYFQGAVEHESASSSIVVAKTAGEVTVFADRLPVATHFDPAAAEEAAHLPLALQPTPGSVAVIGVPPTGTVKEILRHGARRVDVVIEDPELLTVLRQELPESSVPEVRFESGDARRFLTRHAQTYHALLLFSPEPTSALLNRAFTAEFFAAARGALAPGGLVSVALPGHASQTSLETRRLHSSVARTLSSVFGPVRVLPAGRTFYLAALDRELPEPAPIAARIAASLSARAITPVHLTTAMLENLFTPQRLSDAERWASLPEAVNQDLHPTTYRLALDRVLTEFGDMGRGGLLLLAVAMAIGALVVFGPRSRPVEFAVLTSGASGLALELVIMLTYQIATGALYREIGLLLAGFMAGTATGAWLAGRSRWRHWVTGADLLQIMLSLSLWVLLPTLISAGPAARVLAFVAAALAGLFPGSQFAAVARASPSHASFTAGSLYAADLTGAALAAVVTFNVLVPALGMRPTLLTIAAVKAVSLAALLFPSPPAPARESGGLTPILPLTLVSVVLLAISEHWQTPCYAFTFARPYQLVVVVALLAPLASVLTRPDLSQWRVQWARWLAPIRSTFRITGSRLIAFFVLLPVAAFPLARCYFQVPFLFCHTCPRPCVFGVLRFYAVPAALMANLFDRAFCLRICPLGTVQSACAQLRRRRPRRLTGVWMLRLLALFFTAASYFWVKTGHGEGISGSGLYALFYRNSYSPSFWVLLAAIGLLLLSFFVRRPFCEALCPIGAATGLLTRAEDRLVPLRAAPSTEERTDG